MAIPLMSWEYDQYDWPRLGLTHPFIAPYGVYPTSDDVPILISIQNDKEWARLCTQVLDRPDMIVDPKFASGVARNTIRDETNAIVAGVFGRHTWESITPKLEAAQIAYARVSTVRDLGTHPQVRRTTIGTDKGEISLPDLAATIDRTVTALGKVPALGEHSAKVRAEFAA